MRICFYANVPLADIEKIEFYNNDLRILRDLGHEVSIAETVFDVLSARRVDLFFVWWWNRALAPILSARTRGTPVVVCGVFDYFLPYATKHDYVSRPFWQRWLMRTALHRADANVFICQHEKDLVTRLLRVNDPQMIYLAIDGQRYPCKTNQAEPNRLLNIAWSGGENARRKGLFELIRAVPAIVDSYPDTRLVMAGREGEALPALKQLAADLGVARFVEFAGELTFDEKVAEMQRASLYLQPSMYEGFGSAVAEAMACGTPAACTLTGSLPEVMGPCGVHILGGGASKISEAVIRFQGLPPSEQKRLGIDSAGYVRAQFSYESRRDSIGLMLEDVIKRSGSA